MRKTAMHRRSLPSGRPSVSNDTEWKSGSHLDEVACLAAHQRGSAPCLPPLASFLRGAPPPRSRGCCPRAGRTLSRASGRGAARRAAVCASACSIAASRPIIPASVRSTARWSSRMTMKSVCVSPATRRATSLGTARPAPGSSARWRPTARCTAFACSGPAAMGTGAVLLAALQWAVEQGFDVINLSPVDAQAPVHRHVARAVRPRLLPAHHDRRVGPQHGRRELPVALLPPSSPSAAMSPTDPLEFHYNPRPPVEFFARGVDLDVAWLGGESTTLDGQLVRDRAHRRRVRADPRQAPWPDAVRAQEPAVSHRGNNVDPRRACEHRSLHRCARWAGTRRRGRAP